MPGLDSQKIVFQFVQSDRYTRQNRDCIVNLNMFYLIFFCLPLCFDTICGLSGPVKSPLEETISVNLLTKYGSYTCHKMSLGVAGFKLV